MLRPSVRPTLFPYTTLFRSHTYDYQSQATFFLVLRDVAYEQDDLPRCLVDYNITQNVEQHFLKINDRLRSEEHTSELQSRGHLVCRLLLEKKNKHPNLYHMS